MSGGVGPRKIALQSIAAAGCFYFYFYFLFPAGYPAFLNSSALLSGETPPKREELPDYSLNFAMLEVVSPPPL